MFPSEVEQNIIKILGLSEVNLELKSFAETDYSLLWEVVGSEYLLKKSIFSFN